MGSYKVISGQNIYDVALHIYGSIEGITDLLVSNPDLSMATVLAQGQELIYSDDYVIDPEIVAYNRIHRIIPANGERNVYFKEPCWPLIIEARVPAMATFAGMSLSGTGTMEVDWGDNSQLQGITLTARLADFSHSFDNKVSGERKIRLYGDFTLRQANLSALNPSAVFLLSPLYIEELTLRNCRASLGFLSLTEGLYSLDLGKLKADDLLPIVGCRNLMRLDLSGMDVLREHLDTFLIALVHEHYGRHACEVILTETPSGEYREPERDGELNYVITSGMEAVWLLVNESAWNEAGQWRFDICGTIYTKQP
jgi:hypothetical protein